MNTVLCDWPTSEPADVLGPLMLWWIQGHDHDWDFAEYQDRTFINVQETETWCVSEVLESWLRDAPQDLGYEIHEPCPWQR